MGCLSNPVDMYTVDQIVIRVVFSYFLGYTICMRGTEGTGNVVMAFEHSKRG